jgi:hypothetical protein
MKKYLFLIIFLKYSFFGFAQDIIIKTNGKKIYCKVIKVDSSRVYYDQKEDLFINNLKRKDVKEIKYGNQFSNSFKAGTLNHNNELYDSSITDQKEKKDLVHQHNGFYLSISGGTLFGKVTDDLGSYILEMSGTGFIVDFKLGGALNENLILHGTLISSVIPGPNIINLSNGSSANVTDNLNFGEAMFGAGLTYYFMPSNVFFSWSLGLGNFSIIDNNNSKNNVSTQRGFSMQIKIGKEWLISDKWGMGIALTYMKTNLTNKPDNSSLERLDSNRFGILLNVTLN